VKPFSSSAFRRDTLLRVARIDGGVTEPTILEAAALHDTIEDTETTEEELGRGDEIAPLIFDMSVVDGSPQASV
jgi:(p)ppGpp synthase/HD superfamily hydrolase